jgi:DNA-binding IclR family transcriptional regulator
MGGRGAVERKPTKARVRDVFRASKGWITTTAVKARTGLSSEAAKRALDALVEEGYLEREQGTDDHGLEFRWRRKQ